MNKATKGALAAAAAAAILAGGAGTMAAWNSSDTGTDGGTITAGSLNIKQNGAGVWTWANGDALQSSDLLVPGDVVKYTATYDITLNGTNLTATLKPTLGEISGELKDFLTVTTTGGDEVTVTKTESKEITTVVTFDKTKAGADGGMNKQASLSGATVTLQQN